MEQLVEHHKQKENLAVKQVKVMMVQMLVHQELVAEAELVKLVKVNMVVMVEQVQSQVHQ